MLRYNPNEFRKAFKELGIRQGNILFIHSSLLSFGLPQGLTPTHLPSYIYDLLTRAIGAQGTIVVPTFNTGFCDGQAFDRQETPSRFMGAFSEYVRQLPDSMRTTHPIHSIAAIGSKTEKITQADTESAFSKGGAFDTLLNLNAKVLLLGADINAVSFIHLVEQEMNVPYRIWRTFGGEYIEKGLHEIREYKMFARNREWNPILDLSSIEALLEAQNKMYRHKIGSGQIMSFHAKDFIGIARNCIKDNPYSFVSNPPNGQE